MDDLVFEAVFNEDAGLRDAARWVIWSASGTRLRIGVDPRAVPCAGPRRDPATRFTVPAINVRAAAYLTARQAFAAAIERDAGAVIFEIAKSEMAYTDQRPAEYTAAILAAALREGWRTPVFLQGDHFQFNATKWASIRPRDGRAGPHARGDRRRVPEHRHRQLDAGRPPQPTVADQQRVNAENTAELTRLVRSLQPDSVTISIGGEIGEVGKSNSTEEELARTSTATWRCSATASSRSAR